MSILADGPWLKGGRLSLHSVSDSRCGEDEDHKRNARSMMNRQKQEKLRKQVSDMNIGITVVTETWLQRPLY